MKKILLTALAALTTLLLGACSLESPLPRHESFSHFYDQYLEVAGPDLDALDADLAAGVITAEEHRTEREALLGNITQKVNDLVFHNHRLRENDVQRHGLPIAGAPVATPSPGQGFGHGRSGIGGAGRAGAGGFGGAGAGGSFGRNIGGLGGAGSGFGGFGRGTSGIGHGSFGGGPVGRVY